MSAWRAVRDALDAATRVHAVRRGLERSAPWTRTNFAGTPVSLHAGPALALAAAGAEPSRRLAALGAAALGAYDDLAGARPEQRADKGVRGHAAALAQGRVSAGAVKVVGLSVLGLLAARARPVGDGTRATWPDAVLGGAVVAGTANAVNLLDLRPGRALKVTLLGALLTRDARLVGAAAAALPDDLAARTMLGDTGANAAGALLGLSLLSRLPHRSGRVAALAALVVVTAASEKVSFSAVIARTPWLDALDRWGRPPGDVRQDA